MLYANTRDNDRRQPSKSGERGTCPCCEAEVVGKVGNVLAPHWAHTTTCPFDNENEGPWHRKWKTYFPTRFAEIKIGESNRADIHGNGFTVELQNSALSAEDIAAREAVYGADKMIWVFNGEQLNCFVDEVPELTGHGLYTFEWGNKRKSWRAAKAPVFVDLPGIGLLSLSSIPIYTAKLHVDHTPYAPALNETLRLDEVDELKKLLGTAMQKDQAGNYVIIRGNTRLYLRRQSRTKYARKYLNRRWRTVPVKFWLSTYAFASWEVETRTIDQLPFTYVHPTLDLGEIYDRLGVPQDERCNPYTAGNIRAIDDFYAVRQREAEKELSALPALPVLPSAEEYNETVSRLLPMLNRARHSAWVARLRNNILQGVTA